MASCESAAKVIVSGGPSDIIKKIIAATPYDSRCRYLRRPGKRYAPYSAERDTISNRAPWCFARTRCGPAYLVLQPFQQAPAYLADATGNSRSSPGNTSALLAQHEILRCRETGTHTRGRPPPTPQRGGRPARGTRLPRPTSFRRPTTGRRDQIRPHSRRQHHPDHPGLTRPRVCCSCARTRPAPETLGTVNGSAVKGRSARRRDPECQRPYPPGGLRGLLRYSCLIRSVLSSLLSPVSAKMSLGCWVRTRLQW